MEDKQKKILVLEDERPLLEAIKAKLLTSGFTVFAARSVDEGLKLLNDNTSIDVIWLDHYLLGKEDGLDFVGKLKTNEAWKNIPIFVVSNTATPDKVQTYMRLGVTEYFTKSDARLDQIITDIEKVLEKPIKSA